MGNIFQDDFETLLSELGEQISYVPAGGEESSRVALYAVIRREKDRIERAQDGKYQIHACIVQIYKGTHVVYGGFAEDGAPTPGLKFKIPIALGGTPVDGWKVGEIQSTRGKWMLTCTYVPDRLSTGGKEKHAVGAGR